MKKGIVYVDDENSVKQESTMHKHLDDISIVPLNESNDAIASKVAIILYDVWGYSKSEAASEVKQILSSKRISLAAINRNPPNGLVTVGIIGAIPQ